MSDAKQRCPRCGSERTHHTGPRGWRGGVTELPDEEQECSNTECQLPCHLWDWARQLVADHDRLHPIVSHLPIGGNGEPLWPGKPVELRLHDRTIPLVVVGVAEKGVWAANVQDGPSNWYEPEELFSRAGEGGGE